MFQGLRTAIYNVNDLDKAKAWYSSVLGITPYFDTPLYVGFNVGGYELGLNPDNARTHLRPAGVVAYWGVANADEALKRLIELGATHHEDVKDVGEGIRVASVRDPFSNIFGIIENPHFAVKA